MTTIREDPIANRLRIHVDVPATGAFVLAKSMLGGTDKLTATTAELNILPDAVQSLTITRGLSEVGTLTLSVRDAAALQVGTRIRVSTILGTPLFTGKIRSWSRVDDITTITATDAVADLANITRYGATVEETWTNRVENLFNSVPPDIPTSRVGATGVLAGSSVHETSLANWLDIVCNNVRAASWHVSAGGTLVVQSTTQTPSGSMVIRITPGTTTGTGLRLAYSELEMSFDTATTVNELKLINHLTALDDNGNLVANDVESTYTELTSQATYGANSATLDICLASQSNVDTLGNFMLDANAANAFPSPTAVRINAQQNVQSTALIELGVNAYVTDDNLSTHTRKITGIQHEISAQRWMTIFTLGDN